MVQLNDGDYVNDVDPGDSSDSSIEDYYLYGEEVHRKKILIRRQLFKVGIRRKFHDLKPSSRSSSPSAGDRSDDDNNGEEPTKPFNYYEPIFRQGVRPKFCGIRIPSGGNSSSAACQDGNGNDSNGDIREKKKNITIGTTMESDKMDSFAPAVIVKKKRSAAQFRVRSDIIRNPKKSATTEDVDHYFTSTKLPRLADSGSIAESSSAEGRGRRIIDSSPRGLLDFSDLDCRTTDPESSNNSTRVHELEIILQAAVAAVCGGDVNQSSPELVFEKKLTKTDMSDHHQRLLIPETQVKKKLLLTAEEEEDLKTHGEVPAMLVDFRGNRYDIRVRKHKLGGNGLYYIIPKPWNEIRDKAGLRLGTRVQLWAFRRPDSGLAFFLNEVAMNKAIDE